MKVVRVQIRGMAFLTFISLFLSGALAFAGGAVPECLGAAEFNNAQVLSWKTSTPNSYRARGHITGRLTQVFADRNGHDHFEVQIGEQATDTIEVIYNSNFGALPELTPGQTVEACGDYITSIAQAGPYPASPDGAIIHWVHFSPSQGRHASGFLVIDGVVYGFDTEHAGPKRHGKGPQP